MESYYVRNIWYLVRRRVCFLGEPDLPWIGERLLELAVFLLRNLN